MQATGFFEWTDEKGEGNGYSLPTGTAPRDKPAGTLRAKIEALIGDAHEAHYIDETIADALEETAADPRFPHTFPQRHWRRYGTDPLPPGAEALDEPFKRLPLVVLAGRVRSLRPANIATAYSTGVVVVNHKNGCGHGKRLPALMVI